MLSACLRGLKDKLQGHKYWGTMGHFPIDFGVVTTGVLFIPTPVFSPNFTTVTLTRCILTFLVCLKYTKFDFCWVFTCRVSGELILAGFRKGKGNQEYERKGKRGKEGN